MDGTWMDGRLARAGWIAGLPGHLLGSSVEVAMVRLICHDGRMAHRWLSISRASRLQTIEAADCQTGVKAKLSPERIGQP